MRYTPRRLRHRKNDKWEVVLSYKDPTTKERKSYYATVEAKNEKAAIKKRDALIHELEQREAPCTTKTTMSEWLDGWLSYKRDSHTIEPTTLEDYEKVSNQIEKYIGDYSLGEMTIPVINDWMSKMTLDGYSPATVTKAFRVLKQALTFAQSQDLISKNPCDFCKPPKKHKQEINALNREDRSRMLAYAMHAVNDSSVALAIVLALNTGMRRGEICGLRWSDFEGGRLHVRRAIGEVGGTVFDKDTKTCESNRTIPLTKSVNDVLLRLKDRTRERLEFLGVKNADPYILGTQEEDSKPYPPGKLTKDFHLFCELHGFDCTFHDLRHTFATMMISEGVDVRTVSSYLGHASVSMTLNTYAAVDPEAKNAAVSAIDIALRGSSYKSIHPEGLESMDSRQLQELLCRVNELLVARAGR